MTQRHFIVNNARYDAASMAMPAFELKLRSLLRFNPHVLKGSVRKRMRWDWANQPHVFTFTLAEGSSPHDVEQYIIAGFKSWQLDFEPDVDACNVKGVPV